MSKVIKSIFGGGNESKSYGQIAAEQVEKDALTKVEADRLQSQNASLSDQNRQLEEEKAAKVRARMRRSTLMQTDALGNSGAGQTTLGPGA